MLKFMHNKRFLILLGALLAVLALGFALFGRSKAPNPLPDTTTRPALTVTVTLPQQLDWPKTLAASGNIAAWQEAIIGAEISNYRLTGVYANVGDLVRKGQILASIDQATVASEHDEARAAVAELEATLVEVRANSERARQLRERGFFSPQQSTQSITAEQTAAARLRAARARLEAASLRMARTRIVASDDGIISARAATVGSLTQPGQELFRLIRHGRLEWRAEVTAAELAALKPGLVATLTAPDGQTLTGTVRAIAPTVDPLTRTALVYVDLPPAGSGMLGSGMFARGEFQLGRQPALTLPQAAVILREGFAYVFRLEDESGATARASLTKVTTGRRQDGRVEIIGLAADTRVVASGAGFLADGDIVRIVAEPAGKAAQ